MNQIVKAAQALVAMQERADILEHKLQRLVATKLRDHGSLRDMARHMGFTAQYLCDVRYGRRKVSREFVGRLSRLGKDGGKVQ